MNNVGEFITRTIVCIYLVKHNYQITAITLYTVSWRAHYNPGHLELHLHWTLQL